MTVVKKFKSKIEIVIEEADECGYWLEVVDVLKETKDSKILMKEADELTAIFNSIKSKQ